MPSWKAKNRNQSGGKNNRANILMAVIFLSGLALIFRLYQLEIANYSFYAARADGQHLASLTLLPVRGKIFLSSIADKDKIYPFATNKEFAHVYVNPSRSDQLKAPETAEKFYQIFDEEETIKKVDEKIKKDREEAAAKKKAEAEAKAVEYKEEPMTKEMAEYWEIKRGLELEAAKKEIVDKYLARLTKKNDPFETIARKVDEEKLKKTLEIADEGIGYFKETYRYYPEVTAAAQVIGFVSNNYESGEAKGQYGLEEYFNDELSGQSGSLDAELDAKRRLSILNAMKREDAKNGSDLVLTVDRSIEFFACRKLTEAAGKYRAAGGSIIVVNPKTGEIMAMCSYPDFDPNNYDKTEDMRAFENQGIYHPYEPGSVFKAITMAAALDQEKVAPDTTYEDKGFVMVDGWSKPIKNSDYESFGGHGATNMQTVLELSLNTGAIFAMNQIGTKTFSDYIQKFGFGEKTGIELASEQAGNIRNLTAKKIKAVDASVASFGQGITVTPLQMVMAYAAIANGGALMKPYLVKEIIQSDGEKIDAKPVEVRRVISERAATLISGMLVNVVERGHAKGAAIDGYYVAGKTGTAQVATASGIYGADTIHTFIGFAPVENPAFVMLVRLDKPQARYAESTAVPTFGEIAEFILNYLKIPKERN